MATTKKPPKPKKALKPKSLQSGRPPTARRPPTNISSKATQKTIVTYHTLNKELQKAKVRADDARVREIEAQIERLGGLQAYQQASIQGQAVDRGGDSSLVLMQWLQPRRVLGPSNRPADEKVQMLEIGALSTQNACSKSGLFAITRIDLNSQSPGITKQDFMRRPFPSSTSASTSSSSSPAETFDIISLSLVLNFVPDATQRGEMLRRTTKFLHSASNSSSIPTPTLFLVLPAPCLTNSRYFSEQRLTAILRALGYTTLLHRKQTSKLIYHLWLFDPASHLKEPSADLRGQQHQRQQRQQQQHFPKTKIRDGPGMNNFHIILQKEQEQEEEEAPPSPSS